jgi:hypothetical protein
MESRNTNESEMECVSPPALSEDELFAALDGDAPTPVRAHLERCRFCAARLEGMRMFEETLLTAMYRTECPATEALADYVMGTASKQAGLEMEYHLQRCTMCSEEVQTLRAFFVTDAVEKTVDVPAEPLWGQLKDLFQTMGDQLVRILSPELTPSYGQRKGVSQKQVLTYSYESVSVMLTLEHLTDGYKIQGAILDTDEEKQSVWVNGTVEMVGQDEDQQRQVALIDDDESFTFTAVPAGRFNMNIYDTGGAILRLKDIDIAG